MADRHLRGSMNFKVWLEWSLLFSSVFCIHLGMGSTAKGDFGPGHLA